MKNKKTLMVLFGMGVIGFSILIFQFFYCEYRYLEISECTLPISKKYQLVEQLNDEEYSFSYIDDNLLVDNSHLFSIYPIEPNEYEKRLNQLKTVSMFKDIQELDIHDFKVISFKSNGIHSSLQHYIIFGSKQYFQIFNTSAEDTKYTLDYCYKTKYEHNGVFNSTMVRSLLQIFNRVIKIMG